jgi:cellulose synthase/poly-beta-1,6-N-acetylglucosamine synthase-like glycosyltransferase
VTPSLSLILPVRNAQYVLSRQVQWLLEHAPELTAKFEILIADDRSTDFTADIAREICREYPQVRLVSQQGKGFDAGAKELAKQAKGDIVIFLEQGKILSAQDFQKMWEIRVAARQVEAIVAKPMTITEGLLERLGAWGKRVVTAANDSQKLPAGTRRDDSHQNQVAGPAAPSFVGHLKNLIAGE